MAIFDEIIRVFPRRTSFTPKDGMAFVGDPPLLKPSIDMVERVMVSIVFTWDIAEGKRLAEAWGQYYPVRLGGPAITGLEGDFVPGRYVKEGVTFTSRGCDRHCSFCLVNAREGGLREIRDFVPGHIVQDNNFLMASRAHRERVYAMLRSQKAIEFSGGLDARLLTEWDVEQMRSLSIRQLFFACDHVSQFQSLKKVAAMLKDFKQNQLRCYVLCAFKAQTMREAECLLKEVYEVGFLPFAQLYQPSDKWISYSHEWRSLARTWSRPAAMKSAMRLGL